jgi:glycine cleavage system T protein
MSRRSKLYELQLAEGAQFIEDGGWEVVQKFSSAEEEYETLKRSVGLLDLSASGLIAATGPDRVRFLHGMLTNNIKTLKPGQGCYAAMLTPQGRIVADMRVYCLEDSFLLTVEPDLREKAVTVLKRFIIGDRVELLDRSEELALLTIQGPKSFEFLSETSSHHSALHQLFDHCETETQWGKVRVCRVNRTHEGGYDLVLSQKNLLEFWSMLQQRAKGLGAKAVGLDALNIHRVEAGIPRYGVDMDETNLPLEAGLDHAISLSKGCYIGQEITARTKYLGHMNRKLVGLLLAGDNPACRGDKVFQEEKEVGWVTSGVYSPSLRRAIAMGYIRREAMEPGTSLRIEHGGTSIPSQVTPLPFITDKLPIETSA